MITKLDKLIVKEAKKTGVVIRTVSSPWVKEGEEIRQRTYLHGPRSRTTGVGIAWGRGCWVEVGKGERVGTTGIA